MRSDRLVFIAAAVVIFLAYRRSRPQKRYPPRVPTLTFGFKEAFELVGEYDHPFERLTAYMRQLGTTYMQSVGPFNIILTNEPECVQHQLVKNFDNYEKGANFRSIFTELLGEGIFNSNGEQWKYHRSTARPHFNKMELGAMLPTFIKHIGSLSEILDSAATGTVPVDMQDLFMRFTLDSAGEILFGYNIDSLHNPSSFATSFDRAQEHQCWRTLAPFWNLLEYFHHNAKQFRQDIGAIDEFVSKIVDSCLADPNLPARTDLLAEYVKDTAHPNDKSYLCNMLKNMLIAGRDTTAVLLTWTIYELSQHPDVLQRCLDEIATVMGDDTIPTHAQLAEMKYLKMVLNETLRLHPSVPYDYKTAIKEDVLPNGFVVPAGADVAFSPYIMHRMPEWWGPDAESFDPSRWTAERIRSVHPFAFAPFLAGPRICLGQNMAYTEAKAALAMLLPRFTFTLKPGTKVEYRMNIILAVRGGLPIIVGRRQ